MTSSRHLHSADLPRQALHAHTWIRRIDSAVVDLHWTLAGVEIPADDLWHDLQVHAGPRRRR